MAISLCSIIADALSSRRLTLHHVHAIDTLLKQRRCSSLELVDLNRLIDAIASGSLPATPEILHSVLFSS